MGVIRTNTNTSTSTSIREEQMRGEEKIKGDDLFQALKTHHLLLFSPFLSTVLLCSPLHSSHLIESTFTLKPRHHCHMAVPFSYILAHIRVPRTRWSPYCTVQQQYRYYQLTSATKTKPYAEYIFIYFTLKAICNIMSF